MLNKVTLIGRLGQNPEIKTLQNGQSVANFSVATSEKWTDRDGNKQEKTEWHKVVVWGKLAEICAQKLSKGQLTYIEGKLQTRKWNDQNEKAHYVTEIISDKVLFLSEPSKEPKPGHSQSAVDNFAAPSEIDEIPF